MRGKTGLEPALVIAAATASELLAKLERAESSLEPGAGFRLALLNPTPERLARARALVAQGQPCRGTQGIWYVAGGLLIEGGKLAFMFPGVDSAERPDIDDLARHFGLPTPKSADRNDLESRGFEVFATSGLLNRLLTKLGVVPTAVFGHSMGEWSGIVASGLTSEKAVDRLLSTLRTGVLAVPEVVFAALGCGAPRAHEAIRGLRDVEVSHDNCPHQSIICGAERSVDEVLTELRNDKVICQKLDFRSGFHTSFFASFAEPLEKGIQSIELTPPRIPLWSATTCRPYPESETAVRELLARHLVEPVRFRELTEALHADGFRVFAQVGAGSLSGFIGDTLRGRPHQTLNTVSAHRSGLSQFQHFCLGLFAEGADFDLGFMLETAVQPSLPLRSARDELVRELRGLFDDIQSATAEVVEAASRGAPFRKKVPLTLSLENHPELMDHCFYKQRAGWTGISDRFPVMPLTGSIDLVMKLALEHCPGLTVTAVEDIFAAKWLAVDQPKELEIALEFDGRSRLRCELAGYFSATVVLGKAYAKAPEAAPEALKGPLVHPRPFPTRAEDVYREGWLFHGPAFQGLAELGPMGDNGIDGRLRASAVPGALLDNAGQLVGLWIMAAVEVDRFAMPIKIRRIEFFGPQPTSGELTCQVRVERLRPQDALSHFELSRDATVWARVEGWENWRFESDSKLWDFMRDSGRCALSDQRGTYTWLERPELSTPLSDDLARRYLRESERAHYQTLGRKKESWICGRVAAKDAIRAYLWARGYAEPIFPAEIWIENDPHGRPLVKEAPGGRELFVSISHKRGLGVACVGEKADLGIDVELVSPREESFERKVLSESERALLPSSDRAAWLTRFWGAKEAYAKAKGLGLQGDPRRIRITELRADRIRVEGRWIRSTQNGSTIVSQTEE